MKKINNIEEARLKIVERKINVWEKLNISGMVTDILQSIGQKLEDGDYYYLKHGNLELYYDYDPSFDVIIEVLYKGVTVYDGEFFVKFCRNSKWIVELQELYRNVNYPFFVTKLFWK